MKADNMAAKAVAKSNAQTERSKYIDIRYHHVQYSEKQENVAIIHWPSDRLKADALTKPLSVDKFQRHIAGRLVLQPDSISKHTDSCRDIIIRG